MSNFNPKWIITPSLDNIPQEDLTMYKLQGLPIFVGTQEEFMLAARKLFNVKQFAIVQHHNSVLDNQEGV